MKFNFPDNKSNKTNVAIISKKSINYNEYYNLVQDTAKNLSTSQFKSNEKIAIFAENNAPFLILFLAFLQIGIIVVPLNQSLPESQILQLLSSINCNKIFVNDISKANISDSNLQLFQINEFIPNKTSNFSKFKLKSICHEQDSTIIFTSGSSGISKAVLHTFANHYFSAIGSNENIPFRSGDKWLLSLPLFHVGGLSIFFRALVGGGAVVISDENLSLAENIKKYHVTHISLVSTQLMKLLNEKDSLSFVKKLKCILIGGGSVPSELIRQSLGEDLPIYTTYGSTEMASQVTTTKSTENPEKLFTSGKLLRNRKIKIAEDGEIFVKGKTLFRGFVESDYLITPFDSDGWYHTGDLGKIDKEGYLSVIGRKDNMFISGGENIYPEEIENILLKIDDIEDAIVIDILDKKFGARPVAILKTTNYNSISKVMILKQLHEYLPKFKTPDVFYKWPENQHSFKPNRVEFKTLIAKHKLEEI